MPGLVKERDSLSAAGTLHSDKFALKSPPSLDLKQNLRGAFGTPNFHLPTVVFATSKTLNKLPPVPATTNIPGGEGLVRTTRLM